MQRFIFFLAILATFFLPTFAFAQKSKIDSLVRIAAAANDTNRVKILTELCWAYRNSNIDSAQIYGNLALEQAQKNKFVAYYSKINSNLGVLSRNRGDYTKALSYFFEAIKYAEQLNSLEQLGYGFQSVGDISNRQGNYAMAIEYIKKGVNTFQEIQDNRGLGYCYYTLAQVYANQKELDKALEMHQKALEIRRHIKEKSNIASSLGHVANILFLQGKLTEAQTTASQAKNLFKETNDLRGVANMFNLLAQIELKNKSYDIAIPLANEALATAQKSGNIEYMKNAYKNLFVAYEGKKEVKKAFDYQELFMLYEDSVFSQERTRKSLDLQSKYEQEQQNIAIALLKSEEKLRTYLTYVVAAAMVVVLAFLVLGFRNIRVRRKNHRQLVEQQEEIQSKNEQLTGVLDEIRKKNDAIQNSIEYAKRIQSALLLPEQELKNYFPESFILFKPRDVVSGDFYWFAEKNITASTLPYSSTVSTIFEGVMPEQTQTLLIAVADCTGHGVPGAFMSMIGDSLLNQIIHDQEIHRPDQILNHLTKGIQAALHQDETSQNDGMDISIVAIHKNKQNQTVRIGVAGAMNPTYLVHHLETNPELLVLQADKMPIGGATNLYKRKSEKSQNTQNSQVIFTKQSILLNKEKEVNKLQITPNLLAEATQVLGHTVTEQTLHFVNTPCVLYLCSDGFQDQFGGADNRKFMVGKLKKTFVAHANTAMAEQKQLFDTIFTEWKGNYKQTDDVCLIGIKIEE